MYLPILVKGPKFSSSKLNNIGIENQKVKKSIVNTASQPPSPIIQSDIKNESIRKNNLNTVFLYSFLRLKSKSMLQVAHCVYCDVVLRLNENCKKGLEAKSVTIR